MARTPKKKTEAQSASGFSLFDDKTTAVVEEEELPRDEAGRRKIKQQYVDLLGIRIEKLKGRILNRERISKTLEGIYFICARCSAICHNLDEGLVEDEENEKNLCSSCSQAAKAVKSARVAKAAHDAATAKARKAKAKKAASTAKSAKKSPAKVTSSKSTSPKTKSAKKTSKSKD
jgi:hypothetical protein